VNEFFEKLRVVEREIEAEVGGVVLFGAFKPMENLQRWDLIISADWVEEDNNIPAIYYMAHKLQDRLDVEELVSISRVEPLHPSSDFVMSVLKAIRATGEGAECYNCMFNGILMAEAHILAANPGSHPHASLPTSATQIKGRARVRKAAQQRHQRTGTSSKVRKG
jgi:hypothetical protein